MRRDKRATVNYAAPLFYSMQRPKTAAMKRSRPPISDARMHGPAEKPPRGARNSAPGLLRRPGQIPPYCAEVLRDAPAVSALLPFRVDGALRLRTPPPSRTPCVPWPAFLAPAPPRNGSHLAGLFPPSRRTNAPPTQGAPRAALLFPPGFGAMHQRPRPHGAVSQSHCALLSPPPKRDTALRPPPECPSRDASYFRLFQRANLSVNTLPDTSGGCFTLRSPRI